MKISCKGCRLRLLCRNIALTIWLVTVSLSAQPSPLELADSLAAAGFYDVAITEYYRYIFFNPANTLLSDVYSKVGYCYGDLEDWGNAIAAADTAIFLAGTDSMITEKKIDRAAFYLASGKNDDAIEELQNLELANSASAYRAERLLLLAFVLDHDWAAALYIFRRSAMADKPHAAAIESTLVQATKIKYKSASTASILSAIVPGAGQIYNGRYLAALNAMAINGAIGYWTVNNIINENYTSAFLVFLFFFERYYEGNRYQADLQAERHNAAIDSRFEQEVLDLLR
jgi:tetratricopeptide (TPR) repeat protein